MKLYGGQLIYQNHDDDGVLEVVEQGGVRSLHFGSSSRQSSLLMADPDYLQLSYVRAMTSGLIFNDRPERLLNIGLGGGSLVRFFLKQLPDCALDVVEYRKCVAQIAVRYFGLSRDPRLNIVIGDGGRFVVNAAEQQRRYDMIFVDAFDHDGMSIKIDQTVFYRACEQLLTDKGIMTLNIWGSNRKLFKQISTYLEAVFQQRVLYLPVRGRGNVIALAFAEEFPQQSLKLLQARAALLAAKYSVDSRKFLKDLKRNNRKSIHRFISKP